MKNLFTHFRLIFATLIILLPFLLVGANAPVTTAGSASACANGAVCIPITVTDFTQITAISLRLEFNSTLMTYTGYSNLNASLPGCLVSLASGPTRIMISWSDVNPLTLANGSKLVDLCFTVLTGTPTLTFNNVSNGGSDCEYKDAVGNPLNDLPTDTYYINSTITITSPVPTITGPASPPCKNSAGNLYTTEAGMSNYVWTVSSGGIPTAGGTGYDYVTVTWNNAGAQSVSVNYTDGNGCTAASPTVLNFTVLGPTITGPATACKFDPGKTYTTEPGKTNYLWVYVGGTKTAGGGVNDNFVTLTWTSSGIRNVKVTYTDGTCTQQTTYPVTIYPIQPGLTGPSAICLNTTSTYFTETGNANYDWTISSGGVITAGGDGNDYVTVLWNAAGAQTVTCFYTNPYPSSGCSWNQTTLNVNVWTLPVPTITGPASPPCKNSAGNLYTTQAGMSNYVWTVSSGGTLTAGGTGYDYATVTWNNAGAQSVSVNYTNGNGCTAASPTVLNFTILGPTITGPATACKFDPGKTYTTEPGKTNYLWVYAGGTKTAGGGVNDNFVTLTWNSSGNRSVKVTYTDGTCTQQTTYPVTVYHIQPGLTGPSVICLNTTSTYFTETGNANYDWTISSGGVITAGGDGNDYVTVLWNVAGAQMVSCFYTNPNPSSGCSWNQTTLNVTVLGPTITGPSTACKFDPGKTYTTEPGKTNYLWLYAGGTKTAGGGVNDNFVTLTWTSSGNRNVKVTYTDGACTQQTTYPVTVYHIQPGLTGPSANCLNTTSTYFTETGNANYDWTISSGGVITAGGDGNDYVTVLWNVAGAQTVSCFYTNPNPSSGCSWNQTTLNVTVLGPTITGPATACKFDPGKTYTTEPGKTNYLWVYAGGTKTAGGGVNDNFVTLTWTSSGNRNVKVTYTDGVCTQQTTYPVTVYPIQPGLTGPSAICLNTTSTYFTETGNANYDWTISSGGVITVGGDGNDYVTVLWNTAGAQTVSCFYTNPNPSSGCSWNQTTLNINVWILPVPAITGPVSPPCKNSAGNLYTTQAGMSNYVWTVSSGGTLTAGGTGYDYATVTWNNAGAQSVSVSYTDGNGCTAASPTVLNFTILGPTITGPATVCKFDPGNTYTTEPGKTNYLWVYAGGIKTAGGGVNDNFITLTWTSSGNRSVGVIYTDGTCTQQTIYQVTVYPIQPGLAGPSAICVNQTSTYITEAGNTNYVWSISPSGTVIAGGNGYDYVTVLWNVAGAQTVSCFYTNPNPSSGCSWNQTTLNVNVWELPVPAIAGPSSVCAASAGIVYTTQGGMTGYTWTISAGNSITAGQGTSTVSVTWSIAGVQTISVNYINGNNCTAVTPTAYTVTVNPLLPVSVSIAASANPVCAGTSVTYTATPTNGGAAPTYQWKVNSSNVGTNNPVYSYAPVNGDVVSCVMTSNATCVVGSPANSNPITMTVNPLLTVSVVISASANPVCSGTSVTYTATPTNGGAAPIYQWKVNGSNVGTNNPVYSYAPVNGDLITCVLTSNATCATGNPALSNPITMTVNPLLPVSVLISASANPVCTGTSVTFIATPTNGGTTPSYQWKVNGINVGTNNPVYSFTPVNGNVVSCVLTSNAICITGNPASSNAITMTVSPLPVPTITGYTSMCVNVGPLDYVTEPGMATYIWTVSSGNNISDGQGTNQVQVNWLVPGVQWIEVTCTSPLGCSATAPTQLNVFVNPLPGPAGTITGPSAVCGGTNGVAYSVGTIANASSYVWSLPPGASIATGAGTNNITVDFDLFASSGNITVYGNNTCGNGVVSPPFAVTVTPLPATPGVISGPSAVCQGVDGIIYSVDPISNAIGYEWSVPTGATIVAGGNTNSITVNFDMNAFSGTISVHGTNTCGNGAVGPEFQVTVNPIPPSPVITAIGNILTSNVPDGNQWYFEGLPIAGANDQTYSAALSGHYWTVVTLNNCSSDTSNHIYIIIIGIEELKNEGLTIYPNPNDGSFNITLTDLEPEPYTLQIYNNLGIKIFEVMDVQVNGTVQMKIDIGHVADGVYNFILSKKGQYIQKKLIIRK